MAKQMKIIGYEVETFDGYFVMTGGDIDSDVPECTLAEAYRRVGEYIDRNPTMPVPVIHNVERESTPLESASSELGNLLVNLCERHGLNLGLTKDDIERQLAKELAALGAKR
jgi:hypothetical protein